MIFYLITYPKKNIGLVNNLYFVELIINIMERQIKLYLYRTCQLRLSCFYVMTYFKSKKSLLVKEFNTNTPKVSNNELNTNLHTRKSKATRRSFTDDEYNETSYYIQSGLRKVYPYYFSSVFLFWCL